MTIDGASFDVVGAQDYYPYGALMENRSYTTGSNINDKYKFTEKERDTETNYDYFGARFYDSDLGRWLQVDPLADKYPGWSPYNYTLNNPLKFTDPNGMIVYFLSDILQSTHDQYYDERDEDGNYKHPEYRKQFDLLNASTNIYNVMLGSVKGDPNGKFEYNGNNSFTMTLETSGPQSIITRLAHEFQHGVQFEKGEIGFYSKNGGKTWSSFNYDITDETDAYDASLKTSPLSDYVNPAGGFSDLQRYYLLTDQKRKESFLRNHGYGSNRKEGPLNNINAFPNELRMVLQNPSYLVKYNIWKK